MVGKFAPMILTESQEEALAHLRCPVCLETLMPLEADNGAGGRIYIGSCDRTHPILLTNPDGRVYQLVSLATGGWQTCKCGHDRSDHYFYWRNDEARTRCKGCDPNYGIIDPTIPEDSYQYALFLTADHDFAPADPNPTDVFDALARCDPD